MCKWNLVSVLCLLHYIIFIFEPLWCLCSVFFDDCRYIFVSTLLHIHHHPNCFSVKQSALQLASVFLRLMLEGCLLMHTFYWLIYRLNLNSSLAATVGHSLSMGFSSFVVLADFPASSFVQIFVCFFICKKGLILLKRAVSRLVRLRMLMIVT